LRRRLLLKKRRGSGESRTRRPVGGLGDSTRPLYPLQREAAWIPDTDSRDFSADPGPMIWDFRISSISI
jgi:hypothetical protein